MDRQRLEEIASEYEGYSPNVKLGTLYSTVTMGEFQQLILEALERQWQPIETAPKDGKEVLIWNREGWEIATYHAAEEDAPDQPGHDAGWIGTYAHPGRAADDDYHYRPQGQPTLWMLLPAVPNDDHF